MVIASDAGRFTLMLALCVCFVHLYISECVYFGLRVCTCIFLGGARVYGCQRACFGSFLGCIVHVYVPVRLREHEVCVVMLAGCVLC